MPIYNFQIILDLSREISVEAPNYEAARELIKHHSSKIWDIDDNCEDYSEEITIGFWNIENQGLNEI
jgi:hypothetical protein